MISRSSRPGPAIGVATRAVQGPIGDSAADTPPGDQDADDVDLYIKTSMARQHIPGLSLAVIRDGKIIKAKGFGLASVELNVPARPETVYELASATKPFVATAIMLLVQDGKISLEDKVSKFVEDAPDTWKGITVRHLLTHTSGIKDYLGDLRRDFPHDTPPEKIVRAAIEAPLNFTPGEKWSYSNTGYVLLGMIVRKVSGKSYRRLPGRARLQASGDGRYTPRQPGRDHPQSSGRVSLVRRRRTA